MLSTVKWSAFSASEISSQAIGVETDACGSACVEYAATAVAPDLRLPGGDRSFLTCPRGLRMKCLQAMASTAASGRCLIRQKVAQSLDGNVAPTTGVREAPWHEIAGRNGLGFAAAIYGDLRSANVCFREVRTTDSLQFDGLTGREERTPPAFGTMHCRPRSHCGRGPP
jgi:hypothetical protein